MVYPWGQQAADDVEYGSRVVQECPGVDGMSKRQEVVAERVAEQAMLRWWRDGLGADTVTALSLPLRGGKHRARACVGRTFRVPTPGTWLPDQGGQESEEQAVCLSV